YFMAKQKRRISGRLFATWKQRLLLVILVVALLLWAVYPFRQESAQIIPSSAISLQSKQKLYEFGQTPTLLLHVKDFTPKYNSDSRVISSSQAISMLGKPKVAVSYGNKMAHIGASIRLHGGGYAISLKPTSVIKPGSYTVKVSEATAQAGTYTQTTSFAWGDLAFNTDKTVYLPGQTVHIQMAALDSVGHMLCTAPLLMMLTTPDGHKQQVPYQASSSCEGDAYSSHPDYTASYTPSKLGNYKLTLGIQNTSYAISEQFAVRPNTQFDIARNGLTRIVPSRPYEMGITITPSQNFSGIVSETVSNNQFSMLEDSGATIIKGAHQEELEWHVNWQKGKQYSLAYEYVAPSPSPALYSLGPLRMINGYGQTVFQELHGWQIAADFTISFVAQWEDNCGSSSNSCTLSGISTSAGDALILLFAENADGSACALNTVTDSASNSWSVPPYNASTTTYPYAPSIAATSTTSQMAMAYVLNSAALTSGSITVTYPSGPACTGNSLSFDLLEFSNVGVDSTYVSSSSTSAADFTVAQSIGFNNATATNSHVTQTVTTNTCSNSNPQPSSLLMG